jgi:HD-GYP domain-containing protein (c-di-GMP phosphodiesterase class II)
MPFDSSGEGIAADSEFEAYNRTRTTIRALMLLKDGLTGVLGARRREERDGFTSDEMRVLSTLANMTAKAVESAQLHAGLRESYLATVRSLVNSLHERDNYTASHSARVASLTMRMAEHLGWPETMIHEIEVFGPLHDVGKIGIRDDILMKAGPLSEKERAICRDHCVIGERILRPLRPSREALAMVRSHHESWDGRGYPDGLSGEEIPVLARLLQAADAYDAMTSERPYQPALSEQEVVAHFHQYAGVLYDPVAAKALCAVVTGAERTLDPHAAEEAAWQASDLRASTARNVLTPELIALHEGLR